MQILFEPFFIAINTVIAISAGIVFMRKYDGTHPIAHSMAIFGFLILPVVTWLAAFILMANYRSPVGRERRKLNGMALKAGASAFTAVLLLAGSVALAGASIWAEKESGLVIYALIIALAGFAYFAIAMAIKLSRRCCQQLNGI